MHTTMDKGPVSRAGTPFGWEVGDDSDDGVKGYSVVVRYSVSDGDGVGIVVSYRE